MTGRLLSLTLATLVSLLPAVPVAAQGLERVPPPIDVHVSAKSSSGAPGDAALLVPQGAAVRIYGTTVPLGAKGTQVRIEIKPPAGAVSALNAPIAADRSWAATYADTRAAGKYGATAYAADGKNRASVLFPPAQCLARAIAAECLLKRAGRDTELKFGVGFDETPAFQAHAWLVSDGVVVTGGGEQPGLKEAGC